VQQGAEPLTHVHQLYRGRQVSRPIRPGLLLDPREGRSRRVDVAQRFAQAILDAPRLTLDQELRVVSLYV
jgi:hypothetical protein